MLVLEQSTRHLDDERVKRVKSRGTRNGRGSLRRRVNRLSADEAAFADKPPLSGEVAGKLAALLYVWGLSRNGYANQYYAAAVKSGTESWKAFLFGSFDSASFITVDKPPAPLRVMELSGRIFGFSSWSMLLPQALEGVAAVGLLYATIRRSFSREAALLAGNCVRLIDWSEPVKPPMAITALPVASSSVGS